MTTQDFNSNQGETDLAFKLESNFRIITDNLSKIYALASITRQAEVALGEDNQDPNKISILELIEELSSDYSAVYEIERLLIEVPNVINGGKAQ